MAVPKARQRRNLSSPASGRNVMRGRVVHRLTNRAHRHGRIKVRVKIPSGRGDYLPMGGLNWNITSSLMYS